jgi:hypothetical protein
MNKQHLAQLMNDVNEKYFNFEPDLGYDTQLHAEGAFGAMCAAPQTVSKPYIFTITNSAAVAANAVLFGSNIYLGTANFGSAAGITITPANGITYYQVLQNIKDMPFEFQAGRLSCSVATQLDQSMTVTYTDINGRQYTDPVPLSSFQNSFQNLTTMVDFNYPIKINGNTFITLPIVPTPAGTTTVVLTLYPSKIADTTATFVGGNTMKQYDIPVLSGMVNIQKQVAAPTSQWPVVVQNTGAVK